VDGGWLLNGRKGFSTMAQSADVINIFAHPEDSEDPETALSFLISPKLTGIRVEHNWNTLGMRATKSDNLSRWVPWWRRRTQPLRRRS
jgi:alkylation response protein AidB-like acyl-CoA dehydrogenase